MAAHRPPRGRRTRMYVAQFRADDIYTSQITSAVWIDTKLLRVELVPGSTEPGGTWAHPPFVTPPNWRTSWPPSTGASVSTTPGVVST